MSATLPPNPHDPDNYLGGGDKERPWPPDSFVVWDHINERFQDPMDFMMQKARTALTMLAMVYGFGQEDLALIATTAQQSKTWADALESKLEEETGIRFHLTVRQWAVVYTELSNAGGV